MHHIPWVDINADIGSMTCEGLKESGRDMMPDSDFHTQQDKGWIMKKSKGIAIAVATLATS